MANEKILLVEDDFALAMGTEYTLKTEHYEVVHASDLKTAKVSAAGYRSGVIGCYAAGWKWL